MRTSHWSTRQAADNAQDSRWSWISTFNNQHITSLDLREIKWRWSYCHCSPLPSAPRTDGDVRLARGVTQVLGHHFPSLIIYTTPTSDQAAWSDNSEHCSKDSQSPIDITGAAVKNRADFSFDQHHYGKNYTWDGINNGHTIKFTPTGDGDMP